MSQTTKTNEFSWVSVVVPTKDSISQAVKFTCPDGTTLADIHAKMASEYQGWDYRIFDKEVIAFKTKDADESDDDEEDEEEDEDTICDKCDEPLDDDEIVRGDDETPYCARCYEYHHRDEDDNTPRPNAKGKGNCDYCGKFLMKEYEMDEGDLHSGLSCGCKWETDMNQLVQQFIKIQ